MNNFFSVKSAHKIQRIARMFFSAGIASATLLLTLFAPGRAEVRSGFWTSIDPSAAANAVRLDFSSFTPFCGAGSAGQMCIVDTIDALFRPDSLIANYGVLYDSTQDSALSRYFSPKAGQARDREVLFYLDSMIKRYGLKVPAPAVARTAISGNKGVYFIKTYENRFASLIKIGEYIGGIDRIYFYWAYQPDSSNSLIKNRLFEHPQSLKITIAVFSGRVPPVFTLTDSAGIDEIVHQAYISVNTLLDSTIIKKDSVINSSKSGYSKLSLAGMWFSENDLSSYRPYLDVFSNTILYYKQSTSLGQPTSKLYDPQARLEKLIIRVCCKQGLTYTDQYGTLKFCDLIPDSLKPATRISPAMSSALSDKTVRCSSAGKKELEFRVSTAGMLRADLFNASGKFVGRLIYRRVEPGIVSVKPPRAQVSSGLYFVKYSLSGFSGVSSVAVQ